MIAQKSPESDQTETVPLPAHPTRVSAITGI